MKTLHLLIIFLICLQSCNDSKIKHVESDIETKTKTKTDTSMGYDMCDCEYDYDKYETDIENMKNQIQKLYDEPKANYKRTLFIADSLINVLTNEKDSIKYFFLSSYIGDLHYFKSELYYNIGDYRNSITEVRFVSQFETKIALLCNYVKLKDFKKAKEILDSIPESNFSEYAKANYYETIGNKVEALRIYRRIVEENKSRKHFVYYKLAVNRIEELEKPNPQLLNEVYFVTGNPSFNVSGKSDDGIRDSIFDLISQIEEVKNDPMCNGTWIYQDPYDNGKNYYWIKVGSQLKAPNYFKTKYNFIIYQKTFEIKYLDPIRKITMSLYDWRKSVLKYTPAALFRSACHVSRNLPRFIRNHPSGAIVP